MPVHATFRSPRSLIEASGTITIPDLFEWHAEHNADYPLFRFHDGQAAKEITYAEARKGIRRAAKYVLSFAGRASASDGETRTPVAILANAGALTSFSCFRSAD